MLNDPCQVELQFPFLAPAHHHVWFTVPGIATALLVVLLFFAAGAIELLKYRTKGGDPNA